MNEVVNPNWSIFYEKAVKDDGTLFFPERLNDEFLLEAKKKMGTIIFANQYLNEIFPDSDAKFRKEWFKVWSQLPDRVYTFAFIDPAISTEDGADYTGITVVSVDCHTNWYFRLAQRMRLNPTQIIEKIFELQKTFNCLRIGIEDVAYQKALLYMLNDKMQEKQTILPVFGFNNGTDKSKEQRIMGLIPLFEWGRAFLSEGMDDFKKELLQFPRSAHDDIADSAASLINFVIYPEKERQSNERPSPHSPEYERDLINQFVARANAEYENEHS